MRLGSIGRGFEDGGLIGGWVFEDGGLIGGWVFEDGGLIGGWVFEDGGLIGGWVSEKGGLIGAGCPSDLTRLSRDGLVWGLWATNPVYRGPWATSPIRPARYMGVGCPCSHLSVVGAPKPQTGPRTERRRPQELSRCSLFSRRSAFHPRGGVGRLQAQRAL
jgi:hypothetical protein